MENYIGLAAVMAAFILSSKGSRYMPACIAAFYVLYMAAYEVFFGIPESAFSTISTTKDIAACWYLLMCFMAFTIIMLISYCYQGKRKPFLVIAYLVILLSNCAYNLLGMFNAIGDWPWFADFYLSYQRYAIQLDILIAWLASDNAVSRTIHRAMHATGREDHDNG